MLEDVILAISLLLAVLALLIELWLWSWKRWCYGKRDN